MVATTLGLIATLGLVAEKSIEPAIRHYVLLLCNGPGLLLAIIPFALLGGFSTAHGGSALLPSMVVLIVGNPIGFGVLAYLLISLRHQVIPRQEDRVLRSILVFVASVVCGMLGTIALGVIANRRHWCCVNSWAMLHDTGPAVFLVFVLGGFHMVSAMGAKAGYLSSSWPPGWLAHIAYLASALGTVWGFSQYLGNIAGIVPISTNYLLTAIGFITGIVGLLLKMRGREIRQFGVVIASLIVSCPTVALAVRTEWVAWQLTHHVS